VGEQFLAGVRPLVRHEHERWDGSGYPDRLKGDDIPLGYRIVLACDAYDAMTNRPPVPPGDERGSGARRAAPRRRHAIRPAVVEALLAVLEGGPASGELIALAA
jgi:HD-GYP domain-containing protein (c-di-GMP phosphodiesterase class II)